MIVVEKGGFAVNNSNRTHDFVDLLAKISADRGLVFTTADAQKLKDTGYAIQGGTVNGVYDNGTVTLNINSPKALNSVVGHEVVHAMEGSDFYAPLRDIVVAYAEKTGEYDTRLKAIKELYAGKPGYETDLDSKAERELVADLIGDYVFSDPEFVRNLSVSNRNLFQKLYDEIKYLLKVATAGSKEARALEKVKKTFADVYRETKNTAQPDGVKYSVLDRRITAESTEQERYEILKDAELSVVEVKADAIQDVDLGAYNTRKKSAVASGFQELAKRLGILNVDLRNSKIAFPFKFSGANLSKSLHHQLEYGGTYQDYVKAMSCFNEIVESAIPIEVHTEKKTGTRKENPDLKQVYVLVSAYKDGKNIVPVELEVKEFRQRESSLYMTVVLTKIDLEVVDTGVPSITGDVPYLFSRSIFIL